MDLGSWRVFIVTLVVVPFLLHSCVAEIPSEYTFVHEGTEASKISFYDYIIVGGGVAGIPLATTLSANYSVLMLERGGSPYGNPDISYLSNFGNCFMDPSPDSPAQMFYSEDGVANARARVLGGGSTLNGGYYTRDDKEFFKDARLKDEKLVNESYEFVEKDMIFEPIVREYQSAWRDAFLEIGVQPYNGFSLEYQVGTKVGGSSFDQNGVRHTAADMLRYANPSRLTVYLHSTVVKVLFKTQGRTKPTAYAVVFEDKSGNKHRAYLKGDQKDEIIMCAGPLGTPQLLMLSGIGPKDQLDAHQIKVVLDQPLIGKGMADNPLNVLFVPSPNPVEQSAIEVVGTGIGTQMEPISNVNFVMGTPDDYQGFSYERAGFIISKVDGPVSKGELNLRSNYPYDDPSVKFNYFSEPEDLQKCVESLKTALTAYEAKALSKFRYANMSAQDILDLTAKLPANLPVHSNASSSLEQFCKDTVRTIWTFHGGCQIGKVVDDDYKVIGVDSLRVIDGSTVLNGPANVLMLGRYMGVTILGERLASKVSDEGLLFNS